MTNRTGSKNVNSASGIKRRFLISFLICAVSVLSMLLLCSCASKTDEPLDYTKAENWAEIENAGSQPVDVFFVYPTIIDETRNADGYASIDEMESMVKVIRLYQATAYEESCNVYMPYYRQSAMTLASTCNKDNATYLDLLYNGKAYKDIEAALDYYFENCNNGKPFILAGHSQGSAILIDVLTHYMQEHKDYLERMVAAYTIGFAPDESIFNETTGLKFATGENDYNVVISFNTEGPTAEGKSILLPENPMVINPLNWKTDDTYAPASLNKGKIVISPSYDSITEEEGTDDAQINMERKTLICTTRTAADYTVSDETFGTESFHEREYSFYHANIKENVKTRIEAYLADH